MKLKFFSNSETFGWVTDSFFMNCVLVAAVWVGVLSMAMLLPAAVYWAATWMH